MNFLNSIFHSYWCDCCLFFDNDNCLIILLDRHRTDKNLILKIYSSLYCFTLFSQYTFLIVTNKTRGKLVFNWFIIICLGMKNNSSSKVLIVYFNMFFTSRHNIKRERNIAWIYLFVWLIFFVYFFLSNITSEYFTVCFFQFANFFLW